jgi:hypothetical protein
MRRRPQRLWLSALLLVVALRCHAGAQPSSSSSSAADAAVSVEMALNGQTQQVRAVLPALQWSGVVPAASSMCECVLCVGVGLVDWSGG